MPDLSDDELLAELGVEVEQAKERRYTAREERIIAGFEDIVRFFEEHGHAPRHGEDRDIFERLYAVRLDRLRTLDECRDVLIGMDEHGLLRTEEGSPPAHTDEISDDDLLNELGIEPTQDDDIRVLRHVQSAEERRSAEDVANREKCVDFAKFKPLFEKVQQELDSGARETRSFELKAEIRPGAFFIVSGQIAYVADMGDVFTNDQGRSDARLRVIFDNGTQSTMLMRSLQRALNKDDAGRRITEPEAGPLFAGEAEDGDQASGIVYVLRSKSDHPAVAEHRQLIHKIGVTNMAVEKRIAGANLQTTFLMANVEIMAEYRLFNISRSKLENLIHRVFGDAQLDIEVPDRFGRMVKPREWFLVPLSVIDEAIERIKDGTISNYRFDRETLSLVAD
ncbi:GIY-YIG nuclease family protein [Alteriqipengyuania sp. NZ-12B]|uniref:GIY-YIG nuclease family protein n=1 Tax=Alteriqipengyuania abyssalis TaxID=2860200 RepID=A0ABS7PH67_9SPHN|nr:GIY-YIG nuclease family protein [Alteriqipengyuania abyssalis]MBY8338399.1 GIY-YIG nuclease family protein [Alteriqipengyuania abyssalis]